MNYKTLVAGGLSVAACSLLIYKTSINPETPQTFESSEAKVTKKSSRASSCLCGADHSKTCFTGAEMALAAKRAEVIEASAKPVSDFREWLSLALKGELSDEQIAKGVELAKQRKESMLALMEFAPEQAIEDAISWAEYEALPDELKPFVEKPFSGSADFMMMPICNGAEGGNDIYYKLSMDGESYDLTAYDRFANITTKEGMPLQGIQLDGKAALRTNTFQQLDAADHAAVAGDFIVANPDPNVDFYTGKPITGEPVVALGGGQLYYFADLAALNEFSSRLAALDRLNGPKAGSRMLYAATGGDTAAEITSLEIQAQEISSSWSATSKKVLFIIADFSDLSESHPSATDLGNVVNGDVSDSIREMSYGKTWIDADVSPSPVTLPQSSTYYASNSNDKLHADALAAYKTAYPAVDTNQYDIIAVQFTNIGKDYAGLASVGGSKHWIQGGTYTGGTSSYSGVIIHEFGHNYGLSHAHFWDTGGSSVVGSGSTVEYGNIFDIMGDGPDPEGHFHPQAKAKLHWLGASDWSDITSSGTYRLYRGDHEDTTGVRGLRVLKDAGAKDYYWMGYRTAINNETLQEGVVLNWQQDDDYYYSRSWLLDTTPGSADGRSDSAVTMGRTYSDSTAGVHITPVGLGGSGANQWIDVTVNVGSFSGNSAPTASISGPSSGDARTTLTFTASASDSNGDDLAYSWDFGDGKVEANAASVSHSWDIGGTYTVKVTVSDMKGGTVTKSMSVTVSDPLNTWTKRTSGTTQNLHDIIEVNGELLVSGTKNYFRSSDGVTWTQGSFNSSFTNDYIYGLAYGGGVYVAVGMDYDFGISSWVGKIYSSANGTSWTQRHMGGAGNDLNDVVYGDGRFVAVGDGGVIMTSTNGSSWSAVSSGVTTNLQGIAYNDGKYVIVGANSVSQGGTVLTSTNGTSWVNTSSSAGTTQGFFEVEYLNDLFLAGGFYTRIRYSEDNGASFKSDRTNDQERITAFAYGNGVYFAAGTDLDNSSAATSLVSNDGKNWSPLSATKMGGNEAVFFNNTFITVHNGGEIWQSNAIPALAGVVVWQDEQFSGQTENVGYGEDFDGDGVLNIFEYIAGTDPKDGSSHAGPVMTVESGYLTIALDKAANIDGVTIVVEASKDMVSWDTTDVVVVTDSDSLLKARLDVPMTDPTAPQKFLRIKATVE